MEKEPTFFSFPLNLIFKFEFLFLFFLVLQLFYLTRGIRSNGIGIYKKIAKRAIEGILEELIIQAFYCGGPFLSEPGTLFFL